MFRYTERSSSLHSYSGVFEWNPVLGQVVLGQVVLGRAGGGRRDNPMKRCCLIGIMFKVIWYLLYLPGVRKCCLHLFRRLRPHRAAFTGLHFELTRVLEVRLFFYCRADSLCKVLCPRLLRDISPQQTPETLSGVSGLLAA